MAECVGCPSGAPSVVMTRITLGVNVQTHIMFTTDLQCSFHTVSSRVPASGVGWFVPHQCGVYFMDDSDSDMSKDNPNPLSSGPSVDLLFLPH